jgi:RNA polymerase sigma-70 factor (ECF subfamily)
LAFADAGNEESRETTRTKVATPAPGSVVEAAIVRRAIDGDRSAFASLYEAYARPVHAVLLVRLAHADAARDAMHDVFVTALDRIASLRDPRAFAAWLLRIARNRATDLERRRRPVVSLVREPARDAPPHLEAAEVLAAVRELPDAYRETFAMRFIEGMTGPEIAKVTGLRPLSVRVNLHRGMKLLRKRLAGKGDEGR